MGGHEIYNYLSPYPTDGKYQIWLKVAEKFLVKKDFNARGSPDDDGRQTIAIGHLSDSDDLKNELHDLKHTNYMLQNSQFTINIHVRVCNKLTYITII